MNIYTNVQVHNSWASTYTGIYIAPSARSMCTVHCRTCTEFYACACILDMCMYITLASLTIFLTSWSRTRSSRGIISINNSCQGRVLRECQIPSVREHLFALVSCSFIVNCIESYIKNRDNAEVTPSFYLFQLMKLRFPEPSDNR